MRPVGAEDSQLRSATDRGFPYRQTRYLGPTQSGTIGVTADESVWVDLVNGDAHCEDVLAGQVGRVIVGRMPEDLPKFCQKIIELLAAEAVS